MSRAARDVLIMGGGLAGLSLALQLKRQQPHLSVTVLERNRHPVPEAAHKVGESSVEMGAHYFAEVLGLREHLQTCQLPKFGLRYFFGAGQVDDLAEAMEFGVSRPLAVPSFQIDRGIFENHLARAAAAAGVEFLDDACTRDVELDHGGLHRVRFRHGGRECTLHGHWLIDAQGRAGLLQRKLDLKQANGHEVNAVWFRLDAKVDVAHWSSQPAWQRRCQGLPRRYSTNHLMGPGSWVWLIPLASGSTSVGIVTDPAIHPWPAQRSFDGALDWLRAHQPLCARAVAAHRDRLQDFRFLKSFSHGCRQVFSARRWALTGVAGLFLDPFYSPGSDYIGLANSMICDLVLRERAGADIRRRARRHQAMYFNAYRAGLEVYRKQYPLFGNARVMAFKMTWDYACYWGIQAQIFLRGRATDDTLVQRHASALQRFQALNAGMQALFRCWGTQPQARPPALFVDQNAMPAMMGLNRALAEDADAQQLDQRLAGHFQVLEALAAEITRLAPAQAAQFSPADLRTPVRAAAVLEGMPEALMG